MNHWVTIDTQVDLPELVTEESVQSLVNHVLETEQVEEEWSLGIQFIDDATMQAAHAEFMGIDETTDIMTFPYAGEDDVWGADEVGGDLMISVDRARSNARDAGWEEVDEIFFLVVHGLLHLLGWNDHTDKERASMLGRQHELLDSWSQRP